MYINGTRIETNTDEKETQAYIDYILEKNPTRRLEWLEVKIDGDEVELEYQFHKLPPFERIRRITGYLTGTTDKWNDAKQNEERDRVKHGMEVGI